MGEDKSLLPFSSSKTLTQYQYERLKPYFKEIYISSKIDKFDFIKNKDSLILDTNEVYSPIVALKSIFDTLKDEKVFIITVDTPLVKIESINKLVLNSKDIDICIPKTERVHNLCGIFSSNSKEIINEMIKNDIHKVGYLINNSNSKILEFFDEDEFINLNDKNQYQQALKIIK